MMSQETENVLRKSLDAVERNRRRLMWLLAIAATTVAWEFYRLAMVKPTGDVPGMIVEAVMVLFFWSLGLVVLLVFQLTVATKRILRAIELASRPAENGTDGSSPTR
jgi:hypothetical protein